MSVFQHFKLPQLLRKRKSDDNSIVNIPRFDCNALAVKEQLGQGSFGDVYTVDYKAPGKVIETVVVKKVLPALDQEEKKLFYKVALLNGLNHPNIVKMKGVCQNPLSNIVILILSRLVKICVSPRFLVSCFKLMNTSAKASMIWSIMRPSKLSRV